jgi:hypothetical protein
MSARIGDGRRRLDTAVTRCAMDEHILRPVAAWKELGGHRKLGMD